MSVYLPAVVEEAEHHGQVQRIRAGGQRFVEHLVAVDALDAGAVPLEVPVEVALADRSDLASRVTLRDVADDGLGRWCLPAVRGGHAYRTVEGGEVGGPVRCDARAVR
jgi:hypothetical protein